MDHVLRLATFAVMVVAAIVTTGVASSQTSSDRTPMRRAAGVGGAAASPHLALANEPNGRTLRWQNQQGAGAEAEAARSDAAARAAAAAQGAALAAAQQAARRAAAVAVAAAGAGPGRPPAPITSFAPGTVQDIIVQAFTPYGSTAVAWGLRVARCESGYNPRAYNPAGPYYGLFQFLMSTFKATPYGSGDIFDPVANASAAAWKYARGGAGAWGCK